MSFFKTTKLEMGEWSYILGVSLIVLLVHEFIVIALCMKQKRHKQEI